MEAAVRETIYTAGVCARVTPEMLESVQNAAKEAGLKPGAWLRKVITSSLKTDNTQRVLLAEVMALRTILLTLQSTEWRGKNFTDEQLRGLADACEARKFAQADKRILEGRNE
jgi:hypothetical protein